MKRFAPEMDPPHPSADGSQALGELARLACQEIPGLRWSAKLTRQYIFDQTMAEGQRRARAWARAESMALAVGELSLDLSKFPQGFQAGQWALRQEALRGGALGEGSQALWGAAFLAPKRLFDKQLWEGQDPLAWAFSRGMDKTIWTLGALLRCPLPKTPQGLADVDGFLLALERAGVRFDPSQLQASDPQGRGAVSRLLLRFSTPAAFATLARMGCPPWALAPGEEPALKKALHCDNPKGAHLFQALIHAASLLGDADLAKLLGQRDASGQGPMHWAAKALRADALRLLIDLGQDPNELDACGEGAGHAVLTRFAASKLANQALCVEALTRAGFDWSRRSRSGELPIERAAGSANEQALRILLQADAPSYLASPTARQRLARRKGAIASLGERTEIQAETAAAGKSSRAPRL